MKRTAAVILACAALLCPASGCGSKEQDTGKNYEKAAVTQQMSDSYEDALKECFDAIYSGGSGTIFYAYMYPDAVIEQMKTDNIYNELVSTFEEGQHSSLELSGRKLSYEKIVESHEINDNQRAAAKKYLKQLSEKIKPDLSEDDLDIKEGYEVTYSYLSDGESKGQDTVLVVKLNDEGWKVLTG